MITKNEKVLAITPYYKVTATIEAMERAGTNIKGFSLLRSKPDLANKVARLINNEILGTVELDNQLLSLLDNNSFFGPADWLKYFDIEVIGLKLPRPIEELKAILESPCPFVEGKKVKETHYLFCTPFDYKEKPLTVNLWRELYELENRIIFSWTDDNEYSTPEEGKIDYQELNFSKKTARLIWYLMFKGAIPGSFNKTFIEQGNFLKKQGYEVPTAVEVIPMIMLIMEKNKYLTNSELNSAMNGRTADWISIMNHVSINILDYPDILIYNEPIEEKTDNIVIHSLGIFGYKKLYI